MPVTIIRELLREELHKRIAVPEGQFDAFADLWELRTYKRNELIQSAGEVPRFSIFVGQGCVRQYLINDKGEESIVYFAEERHLIGDISAMRTKTPSNFYFQALEACELLTLSTENWQKAFAQFAWWTEAHITGYQKWAARMQQQLADQQTLTGEVRYQNLLKERPSLFQRLPQHFIASYLGLSPETLSRIRKKITQ